MENSGICPPNSLILKEKQLQTLRTLLEERDCIAILPTVYGISLIFQLLPWPWFLQKRYNQPTPMIVVVVSPLTSLIQDQVMTLRRQGIKACCLSISGKPVL